MKSILLAVILLISTFSVSEAIERTYKLPNTLQSRREYKLFCKMQFSNEPALANYCIEKQERVLKLNWFTNTQKEAEDIQRYFSYCIINNRQRVKQGIDKNGRYYELWSWSPVATVECLSRIKKADKQKHGEREEENKLKGEPGPRSYGSSSSQSPNDLL